MSIDSAVVSTLAHEGEMEGVGWYDIDGDGFMDFASVGLSTVAWWKQSATFRGTFGRRYAIGALGAGGQGEGCAVGETANDIQVVVCDQARDEIVGFRPTVAGVVTGAWTKTVLLTGKDAAHTVIAYDIDGDGEDEYLFTWEGAAGAGGVSWLDYDGADPNAAADWTEYAILTSHQGARTFAHGSPVQLGGSATLDVVLACRSVPHLHTLTVPADPTTSWTVATLTGVTWDGGPGHATFADMSGSGTRLDIVAFDIADGIPHYWLASESYSTARALPNPTLSAGFSAWQIFAIPVAGQRDIIGYLIGEAAANDESYLHFFKWNGSSWDDVTALSGLRYGHALESMMIGGNGLVTGRDRYELIAADSGGTLGGKRMALVTAYDSAIAPTKTAPSVVQVASNSNTGTTALTVTLSGTPTQGNLLVVIGTYNSTSRTITPPTGYVPVQYGFF